MSIKLLNRGGSFTPIKIEDLRYHFKRVYSAYEQVNNNLDIGDIIPLYRSVYVNTDEIILIEVVGFDRVSQIKIDNTIIRERDDDRYLYYATVEGYLAIRENRLTILNPVVLDSQNLKMFFLYLPVEVNSHLVDGDIKQYIEDFEIGTEDRYKVLIKEALEPTPSIDAYLEWIVIRSDHPPMLDSGQIDYKSWNRYLEVKKDDLIIIKHLKVDGTPGMDVLGNMISVTPAMDVEITSDDNIRVEESNGVQLFKANCTGLLMVDGKHISIQESLKIESDIDYQTGNITFSGDIEITGDVKSGFSIKCGGNLDIKGTVESGVLIDVKGDLNISRGILGRETTVTVGGNLQVEFIQDSTVRTEGDITVLNSIYHARVFSRGLCTVLGKKIRHKNHGSVVGGSLTSMKGLKLHSVGALASRAELSCGIDYELKKRVTQLREVLAILINRVVKMQMDLDFKSIEQMNHLERELLKTKLLELKRLINQKEELESLLIEMSDNIVSKDLDSIKIIIDKFILEDNKISIGESFIFIKERRSKVQYSLVDDIIYSH